MRVRHTRRAREDLLDIWLTIATDSPHAADRLLDRLAERVRMLERFAEVGVARPDIAGDARMLVCQPYLILYRASADGPQVVRVVHGARQMNEALFREGDDSP